MSAPDFAADTKRFVEIAGEQSIWRSNVKAAIAHAAQLLGIKVRRAKAYYYGEARVIPVQEYYAMKAAVERIERLRHETRKNHDAIRQMAAGLDRVARSAGGEPVGSAASESGSDSAEVPAGGAVTRTPF